MANSPFDHFLEYLHVLTVPADAGDDATLLERFLLHREEAAFAILVQRYGPLVLGVCRRVLRHEQDAEDAFQAAFFVLARKAGSIRNKKSLAAWLYEVAYHIAARMRAENLRRNAHERQVANMAIERPSAEAKEAELAAVLDEELNRLPEKYRRPLVLCYLQSKTHLQVARELGLPAGSLSRRLDRARELLRERLAGRGFTAPAALLGTALTAETLTAAVPRALIAATAHAARLVTLGGVSAAMSISARSIGLAETAVRAMSLARLKMTVVLLMLGSALGGGAALVAQQSLRKQPPERISQEQPKASPEATASKAAPAVRKDHFGDPLPSGAVARLGTVRFRHEGEAGSLVFSPNGKTLAALTSGGVILWDARTGKEVQRLPEIRGSLTIGRLIDFSPDGRILAGPQDSNHVGLWDVATGKQLHTFAVLPKHNIIEPPGCPLHTIRFSPDGRFLAVQGGDNRFYVLDAATGKALHHFKDDFVTCPTFSPDGKTFVFQVSGRKPSKGHEIQVCDVSTGKVLRHWQSHSELICDIAFSSDGKTLAAAGTDRITLWDAVTGEVRSQIKKEKMGQVKNLAFTPDGKTLICGSESDGKIHIWDVATEEESRQLDPRMGLVRSMVLSPDGKTVAAGAVYNAIRLWDVASGRELFPDPPGHSASINAVAFSPDGKLLASGGENRQIWIWDTATGKPVRQLRGTDGAAVAFSPDSKRLVAVARYGGDIIHVWDIASGAELLRLTVGGGDKNIASYRVIAFSPDGKTLMSVDWKNGHVPCIGGVHVWDAATGRRLHRSEFSLTDPRPQCVAFSPDGKTLALGGAYDCVHGAIRLWDLQAGKEIMDLKGHQGDFLSLAYSLDGRTLLSGGGVDQTVRLWETATGKEIFTFKGHKQLVTAVAYSPNGRIVASGSGVSPYYPNLNTEPHRIRFWDAGTGEEIQCLEEYNSNVNSLAFSPDGTRLASGLRNGTVLLWEVPRGSQRTRPLTPQDLGSLWSDLAGEDARRAYTAIRKLTDDPEQAVAFLMDRLRPAPRTDPEKIRQWIADLDSDEYAVRQTAMKELAALEEQAGPLLRERLGAKPPLEVRKRIEELLSQMKVLHGGEVVRGVRAAAVLEQIGTPEARRLLEQLTRGASEARLTCEAKSSLERLAKPR